MATAETTTTGAGLLLDVEEVATLTGISRSTLLKWDAAAMMPAPLRPGNKRIVRWRRAEILGWIEAGCPARAAWERIRGGGE
jgi:excisionase family DNA binding protein